ncbi:hypothetical protein SAMN03080594_10520 [Arenibacter palladensis]|uniref:Uncharacterized protein n=2 Tax=Arenibacter TaxID=178469 RepID=A0A1X7HY53_9FLAO|nr:MULTISPECIES: hypothetical protein [Arenibacter]MDO6603606.1 hypothetical protein [Arenibacter palladensis]SHF53331.1 hypothetical protein SAMN03080594_10520 [Arenibacter palladensis]SMG06916.1 hypothetical protein SAMN03080602_00194 [Arenibacter troitsensis]
MYSRNTIKVRYTVLLLTLVFLLVPELAEAQCAMCRAVLESEGSEAAAKGINNGIVYLMAVPYLLVAGLFFFIYRKMKS